MEQTAPVERVLPVRRVSFEYPEDLPAMWAPHLPEFSAAANAISLGMPYAEPLFIRAMRSTFDRIDPELRARSESYIRQETGHHTQHKKFNDIVTATHDPSKVRIEVSCPPKEYSPALRNISTHPGGSSRFMLESKHSVPAE